jgi:CheY-like chemotaxis protein
MDIGMPVKDGFVASRDIINMQNNLNNLMREERDIDGRVENSIDFHNSEIIALTSFTDKTTKDICKNIGIKEVLNKPIHH